MSGRDDFDDSGDMPDLTAVQADDALLDLIAYGRAGDVPEDDELAQVLVAWQADIDSEPLPTVFDADVAVRMMRAANSNKRNRHRKSSGRPMLVPVAAAAALVVVAMSGVGVAAKSAEPGDPLFGVTKVLYSDYAKSAEAAEKVKDKIDEANAALEEGRPMEAVQSLNVAQGELPDVKADEGRDDLQEELALLIEAVRSRMGLDPAADPSEAAVPSESTSPSESTEPSEPTSPSESTDPSSPSSEPSTETSEPSTSEPVPGEGGGSTAPTGSEPAATGAPSESGTTPNSEGTPTV